MPAALHRARINLGQRHATAGNLSLLVALVAVPREVAAHERVDQPKALLAREIGDVPGGADARDGKEGGSESVGQISAEHVHYRARTGCAQQPFPGGGIVRGPAHREFRAGRFSFEPRANDNMRNIEDRRTTVTAMSEQKTAVR